MFQSLKKSAMKMAAGVFFCGSFPGLSMAQARLLNFDQAHVPNQMIVKFKNNASFSSKTTLFQSINAKALHTFRSSGATLLQIDQPQAFSDLKATALQLLSSDDIEYIEANTIIHLNNLEPNDPKYGELYGMQKIAMPAAWGVSTGSRDVLVAVIDTGIDYNHADIKPNYWQNPGEIGLDANGKDKSTNGIDDDNNGYVDDFRGWDFVNNDNDPMDDNKHGTHCAGTIGAAGNDGVGVVGVNWNVSMVGIKFLSGSGSGTTSDATKSIEYATKIGATLSSNSWGGGAFSPTLQAAIEEANRKDILFIAAAGNSSANNDQTPSYPANYNLDNIVSVAATDHEDKLASFSNYGRTSVHLAAPGVNILSSVPGDKYSSLSGTSMATPHVAGAAALIKAVYPNATAAQIKNRLLYNTEALASLAGKTITSGRLNVPNAFEADSIAPSAVSNVMVRGSSPTAVDVSWQKAGDDEDAGEARHYELRYSSQPITSEADWTSATKTTLDFKKDAHDTVRTTIEGLSFNMNGYLAIKAIDNVGNVGPLSASIPFAVQAVRKVYENLATSLDGVTAQEPWGLETDADGRTFFSDSPNGQYKKDSNTALTLAPFSNLGQSLSLMLSMQWEFENYFDFGYIEISTDEGKTWKLVERLMGSSNWTNKIYSLDSYLQNASSLQVRFRVTSDASVNYDGLKISNVTLFAPAL